jgi:hypothetical protein
MTRRRTTTKLSPSFRGAAFIPQHQLVDSLKAMGLLPPDWKPKPKPDRGMTATTEGNTDGTRR